jgi:hypothetical protein
MSQDGEREFMFGREDFGDGALFLDQVSYRNKICKDLGGCGYVTYSMPDGRLVGCYIGPRRGSPHDEELESRVLKAVRQYEEQQRREEARRNNKYVLFGVELFDTQLPPNEVERRKRICLDKGGLGYARGRTVEGKWIGWYIGPNLGPKRNEELASRVLEAVRLDSERRKERRKAKESKAAREATTTH